MSQNPFLTTNFRCGEIFQEENHEFIIVCVVCHEQFYSFSIFTNHIVNKICSSNVIPLLQRTLKIEKEIIDDLLVVPKIESTEIKSRNDKRINIDECLNNVTPKIEPIEISDDNSQDNQISNSVNKNVTINKVPKESNKNFTAKPIKRTRIIKKKIIWDPDDPKVQLLCENYQNQTPKNQIKKCKEIAKPQMQPISPKLQIKQLPKKLETINLNNSKQLLVKTFQKQSRIGISPRKTEQSQKKKIKRIKKVIWDPDAPEDETGLYKSKTNIDSNNLEGIKLPHAI